MTPNPEEIKKHAINFVAYCKLYNSLVEDFYKLNSEDVIFEKTVDKLYEEFTEGKPVSL